MKKLVISVLAAIFITVIIPLAIVELTPPRHNALPLFVRFLHKPALKASMLKHWGA